MARSLVLMVVLCCNGSTALLQAACTRFTGVTVRRSAVPAMGLFDMFQESEETKARKDAQFREQQEMLARRRNPEAMRAYEAEVEERRAAISSKDAELKELQKTGDIEAWEQLRAEGKLKSSDELDREAGDRSWGGEGLVAERIDTRLPFVDSGYVDESQPDLMGGLKKLFGGNKEENE
eukprot:CAMPEP_0174733482 /NCGR_PEP_ID=MMETSP1094-20130205/61396_1 /TAXON_ID=156173 /ORGANISM="Chrysochromulina brevifilum, Strain UTEX LB 985" /LENGTH=178 /DNA_ID=CAMNT_0015936141 /DNA_START=80 /DNA_END=616 /DNA_ORIENTATION=-